jgi:hypothetical protein
MLVGQKIKGSVWQNTMTGEVYIRIPAEIGRQMKANYCYELNGMLSNATGFEAEITLEMDLGGEERC